MVLNIKRISAYALILSDGYVLLSKLNRGPNKGKWNLVGGGIHHGEEPLAALRREVKEETGISVSESPELLNVLSERYIYQNSEGEEEDLHLIGVIYLVRMQTRTECKVSGDGDSSDECRWFSLDELSQVNTVLFVSKSLALLQ